MPRKNQQWVPLDGAVDHASFKEFALPSRRKRPITIKRPEDATIDPGPNLVRSDLGGVGLSGFPSIDHRDELTGSDTSNASEREASGFQQREAEKEDGVATSNGHKHATDYAENAAPIMASSMDLILAMKPHGLQSQPISSSHTSSKNSNKHPSDAGREEVVEPSSDTAKRLPLRSNLDIYAHKYVPAWQTLVNESPAARIYSPHLQRVDFDVYKSSFASQIFLPRLPEIELPPTDPCQIYYSNLEPHAYEPFWKERLHNEFAAQRLQNTTFDLFSHQIHLRDAQQCLYQLRVPGVREYAPRIDLGDILIIRPLQPVLQGTIAQQAQIWSQSRRDEIAPGFGGTEHHAVVWSIMRRDEIVIVKLGQILHGDPRDLKCNVIIPLQAHKNAPAWRAIDLATRTMNDTSRRLWLHSMLFPEATDSIVQHTLSKGTFDLDWYDTSLNFEQKRAVQAIVNNDYGILPYLISGPPGTGKTKTLVEVAMQLISTDREDSITPHILLCAPSDAAADTLLIRLSAHLTQTKLFRLNNWTRLLGEVPGEVRSFCYIDESTNLYSIPPFRQTMNYQIVVTSCRDANMLLNAGLSNDSLATMTLNLLGTIAPSAISHSPPIHWTALLLDEAAQATEPEALIPITIVQPPSMIGTSPVPQVIMAGDEYQLGPRLVSTTILASTDDISTQPRFPTPKLNVSLFQRLFERLLYAAHPLSRAHGLRPLTRTMLPILRPPFANLIRNYRSHPAILSTSSHLFYADTLIPERPDVDPSILSWPRWPSRHKSPWPVMFIQNTSEDSVESVTEGDGTGAGSLINRGEAPIALETVQNLLAHVNEYVHKNNQQNKQYPNNNVDPAPLHQEDIIVLSPFRAQVTHLRNLFRTASLSSIRIGPLEAFQGLESRIVLICTTRTRLASNPTQHSGKFVADDKARGLGVIDEPKRFNVAMTRAREGLIVIGSRECLGVTGDRCWREFLGFVGRNGLGVGVGVGEGGGSSGGFGIGGRKGVSEMGKLERALRWADGLERERDSNGFEESVSNGNGYEGVQHIRFGKMNGEATGNFKFRLMGRMIDMDERMWEMQAGEQDEVEYDGEGDFDEDDDNDDDNNNNDEDENNDNRNNGTINDTLENGQNQSSAVWADRFKFTRDE